MRTPRSIALVLAGVLFLAGCSAGDSYDSAAEPAADYDNDGGMSEPEAPADSDDGFDVGEENRAQPDTGDGVPDGIDPLVEAGMVFVTTTTVGLQVEDPYPVLGEISAYAEAHGGGRVYRNFTAATEYQGAHGFITVKLPPRELNAAVDHLSTLGEVKSLEETRDDITVRVTNLAARIRIAQMALDRAEGWFAAATTREEEMALEPLLADRIIALDELQSQQAADSHDTALSTLTVEVYSPDAAPPPEPEPEPEVTGFWAGLTRGWNAFYDFGSDALLVIGALLPWLVFLGLLLALVLVLARWLRTWRAQYVATRPPRPARPRPGPPGAQAGPTYLTQQHQQGPAAPPQGPGRGSPPPAPPAGGTPSGSAQAPDVKPPA